MKSWARTVSVLTVSAGMAGTTLAPLPSEAAVPSAKSQQTIGLVCTWVAFDAENESFVIDFANQSLYWVNQNQMMTIKQFNAGRVVAEGVRNRLKVSARDYEEKVPVRVIFDRVGGGFILLQEAMNLQATGSCEKRYTF